MRFSKSIVAILTIIVAGGVWAAAGGAAGASSGSGVHAVSKESETNDSSAVEDPTWGFNCSATSGSWHFEINDVQVIDASGHPWNGSSGPWSVTFFASDEA